MKMKKILTALLSVFVLTGCNFGSLSNLAPTSNENLSENHSHSHEEVSVENSSEDISIEISSDNTSSEDSISSIEDILSSEEILSSEDILSSEEILSSEDIISSEDIVSSEEISSVPGVLKKVTQEEWENIFSSNNISVTSSSYIEETIPEEKKSFMSYSKNISIVSNLGDDKEFYECVSYDLYKLHIRKFIDYFVEKYDCGESALWKVLAREIDLDNSRLIYDDDFEYLYIYLNEDNRKYYYEEEPCETYFDCTIINAYVELYDDFYYKTNKEVHKKYVVNIDSFIDLYSGAVYNEQLGRYFYYDYNHNDELQSVFEFCFYDNGDVNVYKRSVQNSSCTTIYIKDVGTTSIELPSEDMLFVCNHHYPHYVSYDSTYHNKHCYYCGYGYDYEKHTYDEYGICIICGGGYNDQYAEVTVDGFDIGESIMFLYYGGYYTEQFIIFQNNDFKYVELSYDPDNPENETIMFDTGYYFVVEILSKNQTSELKKDCHYTYNTEFKFYDPEDNLLATKDFFFTRSEHVYSEYTLSGSCSEKDHAYCDICGEENLFYNMISYDRHNYSEPTYSEKNSTCKVLVSKHCLDCNQNHVNVEEKHNYELYSNLPDGDVYYRCLDCGKILYVPYE